MRSHPQALAAALACAASLALFAAAPAPRAQKLAANSAAASYSALEQEVIRELNLARTRPADYAAHLEELRALFSGRELRRPGRVALVTEEGPAALEEAIRFLRAARPLPPLTLSPGMCSGAKALVEEQSASGATGHRGADGSFCEQRASRFGAWQAPIGENLSYGDETARERVIALIIDDGVANRGHRARIFNPSNRVVGVACGSHQMGAMCVLTFAGGFTDRPAAAKPGAPRPAARSGRVPKAPAGSKKF